MECLLGPRAPGSLKNRCGDDGYEGVVGCDFYVEGVRWDSSTNAR